MLLYLCFFATVLAAVYCEPAPASSDYVDVFQQTYMKGTRPPLRENRYYLQTYFEANWFKALQYCRFLGMDLVSISTKAENNQILNIIKNTGIKSFWTSGNVLAEEGKFVWMGNGEHLTFTYWHEGEPNHAGNGEECLQLWNRFDGLGHKWDDTNCYFKKYFLCEVRRVDKSL